MRAAAVSQSPSSSIPLSYFQRIVHLVNNLPEYADKASMAFNRWYFSCGLRVLFFLPPFHGNYLMAALPSFLVATGYKHQIPILEVVGSIHLASLSRLFLLRNREKIRSTENVYEKDFLKIFSPIYAAAAPALLSWAYLRSGLGFPFPS